MMQRYPIAEARNRFAEIVHKLEKMPLVEVTRRGKPVAVLLSIQEYERLLSRGTGFWEAYEAFRDTFDLSELGIEPSIFQSGRDKSPGREVTW